MFTIWNTLRPCEIIFAGGQTCGGTGIAARGTLCAMKQLFLASLLLAAACTAQAAPTPESATESAPAPSPREWHSAQCVAALEVDSERLAAQVKSGQEDARATLQSRLESAVALVGEAYLNGTQDEGRARAMASRALEAQKSLSRAALSTRQQACADEGSKLLAASNSFERALVKQVAKKRMKKLLDS